MKYIGYSPQKSKYPLCFLLLSAKKAEGPTQCWLCQEKFSVKSTKIALHRHILDEMTVREAIETLLPDESITLQGTVYHG